jgi:hypothetical protein
MEILHSGPRDKYIASFHHKHMNSISTVQFYNFWSSNSWIRSAMLNPDPH